MTSVFSLTLQLCTAAQLNSKPKTFHNGLNFGSNGIVGGLIFKNQLYSQITLKSELILKKGLFFEVERVAL